MQQVDFARGWAPFAGVDGIETKTLSDDLDEAVKTGGRTRMVRIAPGTKTEAALVHDYWEEVYVLSGDFSPLGGPAVTEAPAYCCRPPGAPHGPFGSRAGCLLLEVQYYARNVEK
jgi:hypothetical protein